MGNWSNAPLEVLVFIADKLKLIEDYVAFRSVCSGWRSASPKQKFTGTTQLACLIHAPNVFRLSEAAMFHLGRCPPRRARGSDIVSYKYRCFASKGWIFGINVLGGTCLYHPFSATSIVTPMVVALPEFRCELGNDMDLIVEAVLSFSPSSSSSNYTLILRYESLSTTGLAFWRPGKDVFVELDSYKPSFQWFAITTCEQGHLYTLDLTGTVVIWDTEMNYVPSVQWVIKSPCRSEHRSLCIDPWLILFAECDGEVFLVGRTTHGLNDLLVVHRIDVANKECVRLDDLGGRALFFGVRARLCFFMEPPGCMPNYIYLDEKRIYYKKYVVPVDGDEAKPGIYSFPNGPLTPFQLECHGH